MDQALWYPVLRERKRDKPKWEKKRREKMKNNQTLTGKSYLESKETNYNIMQEKKSKNKIK